MRYAHVLFSTGVYDQATTYAASQGGTFHTRPRRRSLCGLVLPGSYGADAALPACPACVSAAAERDAYLDDRLCTSTQR